MSGEADIRKCLLLDGAYNSLALILTYVTIGLAGAGAINTDRPLRLCDNNYANRLA